jgi:UDP-N-acetylmuramate--alanine ligase
MIAHILASSGAGCTAFLGGIATNYNSNFIQQGDKYVVIEADEFDRSFHRLSPDMAVITAVDTDHLDIYGTKENIDQAFIEFVNKIDEEGFLVMKTGQSINDSLPVLDKAFYALNDTTADVYCSKYWVVEGGYIFNIMYFGKEYVGLRLNIGGFHNIENAIAAFTIAKELNISVDLIKAGIASFKGIKRRFEKVFSNDQFVFIDDYAHHPEEIRVLLESVKEMFPDKKITAVFQPHLFSRTKDLAEGFAKSLSTVDEVLLLDIYPARELPMEGVTSKLILDKVTAKKKGIVSKEDLLAHVREMQQGVVLTIGAGDIDKLVEPIKEIIASK